MNKNQNKKYLHDLNIYQFCYILGIVDNKIGI